VPSSLLGKLKASNAAMSDQDGLVFLVIH